MKIFAFWATTIDLPFLVHFKQENDSGFCGVLFSHQSLATEFLENNHYEIQENLPIIKQLDSEEYLCAIQVMINVWKINPTIRFHKLTNNTIILMDLTIHEARETLV
jgi:hypothetical protein